jgi:D-alanine transaminase
MSAAPPQVFLNGEMVAADRACVPIMDRGLQFGDSVYEVVPAYGARLFRLPQHLARLDRSLSEIGMRNPYTPERWEQALQGLVEQLPGRDQQAYIQITRGAQARRSHAIPERTEPNAFAFTAETPEPDPRITADGIAAITLDDFRWQRCDIKATTLLANVLSYQQARERQADEAILVRDDKALEGTASNLFMVAGGLLMTPPNSQYLLPGVTRDLVLLLARRAGLPTAEAEIAVTDLERADEIWLTSSTRELMPVARLNGRAVGNGRPGPIWERMNRDFQTCKQRLRETGDCGL